MPKPWLLEIVFTTGRLGELALAHMRQHPSHLIWAPGSSWLGIQYHVTQNNLIGFEKHRLVQVSSRADIFCA